MKEEKTTLIKPKKEKDIKDQKLLSSIIMLIIGIILLTNSSKAVIIVCYCLGFISMILGAYNLYNYYNIKTKLHMDNTSNLVIGVASIFIGFIIVILAGAIETFLRFIIGLVLLYNGIKKTMDGVTFKNYVELSIGIVLIACGLYTILAENIVFMIVGALLVISSVIDLIDMYKQKK